MMTRFGISGFRVINNFKFCQMYQHEKGIIQMTSSWLFRDLVTIYRPNTNFKLAGLLAWCSALVLSKSYPGNTCTSQIKNAAVEYLFQYVISSDFLLASINTFICSKWTKQTPAQMWKELQNYNHEVFSCPPQKYTFFVSKPIFGVKVWVASQI